MSKPKREPISERNKLLTWRGTVDLRGGARVEDCQIRIAPRTRFKMPRRVPVFMDCLLRVPNDGYAVRLGRYTAFCYFVTATRKGTP